MMLIPNEVASMMRERLSRGGGDGGAHDRFAFSPLHWMVSGLFVAAGAEALASRRLAPPSDARRRQPWKSLGFAPLLVAPLAGAAHALEAMHPARRTRRAARAFDRLAVGAAAGAAVAGVYAAALRSGDPRWRRRARDTKLSLLDAISPLTFGATGALGLLLDREAREAAAERRRLERRASVLERLVPRRTPKFDRIVIHV